MATIYQTGNSPYWQAYIWVWKNDKRVRVSRTTRTKDEEAAREIADELQRVADLAGGGQLTHEFAAQSVRKITEAAGRSIYPRWSEAASEWLEIRGKRVGKKTKDNYRGHINDLTRFLGRDPYIIEITLDTVQGLYDALRGDGMKPGPSRQCISTISAVFKRQMSKGVIYTNPCEGVEKTGGLSDRKVPFTAEEVQSLIDAVYSRSYYGDGKSMARDWHTMILTGWCTGQREGDCSRLSFDQTEMAGELLTVTFLPAKKLRYGREVTLPVLNPLRSHLLGLPHYGEKGPWCPELCGMNTRQLCYHFDRIMTEAGIEIESMSGEGERSRTFRNKGFHSFRHTMTSTLKNAGVPAEWRMMMLDHDSEEVHAGYSHSDVETIAKWVGGVNLSLPG